MRKNSQVPVDSVDVAVAAAVVVATVAVEARVAGVGAAADTATVA
eukprot:CAMPEP_0195016832 /NCGR_PEP_ID=MMETSP0326_2-20130528/25611_1 /TAXON_ID=2866 ORGANISM="Crypthecodinium cohnii, Strain Seligo" /NCGR_SAMPLE_ID=MMETSP0326_2 /ASSEMBLY_ACC=CAM_ASM_000348 /LENGTH=44 /DNA_ID= /DNA_START= /DNA_END= /DNA_ORIENTATION=